MLSTSTRITEIVVLALGIWMLAMPLAAFAQDGTVDTAEEVPTSMPIDWKETGWSRIELASMDLGYMNGAVYGELKGFGYHRSWFRGFGRLSLGVDVMDVYAGKAFHDGEGPYQDVACEAYGWFPIRASYVLFGKAKIEREQLYDILEKRRGPYSTHYRYRELGSVPRTMVSPLVLVGVATSRWGTRALSSKDFPEYEQDFSYVDFFVEASFSTLATEPPTRPMGMVGRITAGIMMWKADASSDLPAMEGTEFYIKIGFGGLEYKPRR